MRVYVMTSDRYLHMLRPFGFLFNKYWSADQEVIVCGFTPPPFSLPPNFRFMSLGRFEDYPINRWSDALIRLLLLIPDEVFGLMFEDYLITRPVHMDAIRMLYDYMVQFKYVLKMDLITDRRFAAGVVPYGHCGYLPLVKSDYNSPYHMSMMAGLWNRNLMGRFVIPNETPWDLEITGTTRVAAAKDSVIVLGTETWTDNRYECPLHHTLAHRGGDPGKLLLDELNPADVEEMIQLGYIKSQS